MSVEQLRALERASQVRNRAEHLTGFTLYDEGRFFQWLEGPAQALARVWDSVRQDRRHTDIHELKIVPTPARVFAGSEMTVSFRDQGSQSKPLLPLISVLDPLLTVVEGGPGVQWGRVLAALPDPALPVIPIVRLLAEAVAIPHVLASRGSMRRFLPPVSPSAAKLSRLLLADDPGPSSRLLRSLYRRAGSLAPLCATVIEPAARGLGDLWASDDCSQIDMVTGLGRLQEIIRRLSAKAIPRTVGLPVVLVAPQPGEVHLLGAALDAELLWQAGWDTHQEFPATDDALHTLVSDTWFDVLDLSLSTAMRREDWLPRMTATIAGARAASRNPALTVVVGGRAFFEQCHTSATVGADASTTSAFQVVLSVASALQTTRTKLASESPEVTGS
jgi:hypothetical protein